MAKPRLKVYRTAMGFADAVVAAPNQQAALEAWGAHQNLFADGAAQVVTDDAEALKAASARPGVVLRRAIGSTGPWGEAAEPPQLHAANLKPPAKKASKKSSPTSKPKPDRARLTAAEKALERVEAEERAALADLGVRREALDRQEAEVCRHGEQKRQAAFGAIEAAKKAYRASGGKDG